MFKRLVTLSLFFLSACASSQKVAELGIISTEITNIDPMQLQKAEVIKGIKASDSTGITFIFPNGYPSLEFAVRRALEKSEADILVNVEVTYDSVWFILGGQNTITVTADAVKLAPMFSIFAEEQASVTDKNSISSQDLISIPKERPTPELQPNTTSAGGSND